MLSTAKILRFTANLRRITAPIYLHAGTITNRKLFKWMAQGLLYQPTATIIPFGPPLVFIQSIAEIPVRLHLRNNHHF